MARLKNFKAPASAAGGGNEKTVVLSFRLSADDHRLYMKKLRAANSTVSDFMRDCVLSNKTQVVGLTPAERAAEAQRNENVARILRVVAKAGNNINQLAHRANSDALRDIIDDTTYEAIRRELEYISISLKGALRDAD